MLKTTYETHNWENPLLPLIFHTDTVTSTYFPPNWHENIELLFCLSGHGYVKCDTETLDFTPGTLAVVNSGVLHSVHSEKKVVYHCLIIGNNFCKESGLDMTDIRLREMIRDERVSALYSDAIDAIRDAKEHPQQHSVAQVRACLLQLLAELCRRHTADGIKDERGSSVSVERVKQAILYIKSHLSHRLTLDEISRQVNISKYHLSREFKALTGQSVFEMVNLIRCKEAKRLITGGASVSEAATACGFENLSYFSRCFKKRFGTLPSKCKNDFPPHNQR